MYNVCDCLRERSLTKASRPNYKKVENDRHKGAKYNDKRCKSIPQYNPIQQSIPLAGCMKCSRDTKGALPPFPI